MFHVDYLYFTDSFVFHCISLIVADLKFLFESNATIIFIKTAEISLNSSTLIDGEICCCVFLTFFLKTVAISFNYSC